MNTSIVSMARILALATNVVRKVISPATVEKRVVTRMPCSTVLDTAKITTVAMAAVAMMARPRSSIRLLNLVSLMNLLGRSLSMLPFLRLVFEKARKVVRATSISRSRCMILVLMMSLTTMHTMAAASVVGAEEAEEAEEDAVAGGVVVAIKKMMEAIEEENLATRTHHFQRLLISLPLLLRVVGQLMVIAPLQQLLDGKTIIDEMLILPEMTQLPGVSEMLIRD